MSFVVEGLRSVFVPEGDDRVWKFVDLLVFPAASRPSISRRISFDPKILPIILEICPPIFAVLGLPQQQLFGWREDSRTRARILMDV